MDKKDKKQHQNLSLHERYLALLDKHNAETKPEDQPQIKNEVVKKALTGNAVRLSPHKCLPNSAWE